MGMVEGPFSKEEAASRCGCASADLCPGPLAGIDEGDKIRTIYDGSVGGANDTIRNQTVERTTAPTVLDGVQALHWLHAAAEEGPPSQGASGPEGGIVQTSTWGLALAGGCCSPESEGAPMAWLVPNPTGDAWQPFCSGSSTRFSLKWTGTSSSSTTSCGCFEAGGQ